MPRCTAWPPTDRQPYMDGSMQFTSICYRQNTLELCTKMKPCKSITLKKALKSFTHDHLSNCSIYCAAVKPLPGSPNPGDMGFHSILCAKYHIHFPNHTPCFTKEIPVYFTQFKLMFPTNPVFDKLILKIMSFYFQF